MMDTLQSVWKRMWLLFGWLCVFVGVQAQTKGETGSGETVFGSMEVEHRLLLFVDELTALQKKVSHSNLEQLKVANRSLTAIDHKWMVYSQAQQGAIAADEHLMDIVVSYQANKQMVTDSIQGRQHKLESLQAFLMAEEFLASKDSEYEKMYESSQQYMMLEKLSPLLEKLKGKEQLVYAEVTKHYEAANAASQEFGELKGRMKKVEEQYIQLTNVSEKIQAAEYKPFLERIKDYLYSFAAVAIVLMFFNMIQSKIQAYKQMRKSAEEYKKMLSGNQDEYPTI